MTKSKDIGIVGMGMVGEAMLHIFPEAIVYDIDPRKTKATREEINQCETVFICTPTNSKPEGYDYGPLQEVIGWITAPLIVVKSTVQPGMTDSLIKKTGKTIVFNPEFLREKSRFEDIENENRIIVGTSDITAFNKLKKLYRTKYNSTKTKIIMTAPKTAELVKLVNNTFLATKVTFCNEVRAITDRLGIDYNEFRDIWLLDPRIGESHTTITKEGGFGGSCLPKDLNALIKTMEELGESGKLFKEVWNTNCKHRQEFKGQEYKDLNMENQVVKN